MFILSPHPYHKWVVILKVAVRRKERSGFLDKFSGVVMGTKKLYSAVGHRIFQFCKAEARSNLRKRERERERERERTSGSFPQLKWFLNHTFIHVYVRRCFEDSHLGLFFHLITPRHKLLPSIPSPPVRTLLSISIRVALNLQPDQDQVVAMFATYCGMDLGHQHQFAIHHSFDL